MKTILLSLLFIATTYGGALETTPGRVTIAGRVIQRTMAGLLVTTNRKGDDGDVWLVGYDAREGMRISTFAVRDGVHEYETTTGASRVVDQFRAVKQ